MNAPELVEFVQGLAERPQLWSHLIEHDRAARCYSELLRTVRALDLLSGFCYTQFADTYQEANGLLYADRRPKFPIAAISAATGGTSDRTRPARVAETDGTSVETSGRPRG